MDYEYYPDDDFEHWGDDYDGFEWEPPTRTEEVSLFLRNTWFRLTHPVYTITHFTSPAVWRFLRRFTRCRHCGKRGTIDGLFCQDHYIPF